METLLIAGATGNTGSEVVRQLSAAEIPFSALIRDRRKAPEIPNATWVEGNFTDRDSLAAAFDGHDRIYVAMPAHPDNAQWMHHLLDAAQSAGVRHVVKLSGMGANLAAGSEIIRVHAQTDALLKASGIAYTLLQPNSFYQNILSAIATIQAEGAIYISLGESRQSFIDIRDVAAVAVKALTEAGHAGKTYLLSGPEALSFHDLAEKVSKAIGKPVTYHPISDAQMQAGLLKAGLSEWEAEKLAEIFSWFAKGGYEAVTPDVESVLGRPPLRFDDFMTAHKHLFDSPH
ncbi:MAG: SDR family oxidoreductase [Desulfosarcinaceae bacterium]|nr:SDR family oxidoreductase [Desulfosarcinaceae bacterium]